MTKKPELLIFKIENSKPILVKDLVLALSAIEKLYNEHLIKNGLVQTKGNDIAKIQEEALCIKNIKEGSHIFEMLQNIAISGLPFMHDFNSISSFVKELVTFLTFIKDKTNKSEEKYDKEHYENAYNITNLSARDNGLSMSFIAEQGSKQSIVFNLDNHTGQQINHKARQELITSETSSPDTKVSLHRKQLFTWAQTSFGGNYQAGNKGKIENLYNKPLKVTFETQEIKNIMTSKNIIFDKEWHKLAYVIDVDIQYIDGIPKQYKILHIYKDETFDPED